MHTRLFLKNLLMFLMPLLVPILILGTLSMVATRQHAQSELDKSNMRLFHQVDRSIELIFNEMDSLSTHFGNPEVMYRLEELLRTQTTSLDNLRLLRATQNYIDGMANAKPYIASIYAYVDNPYNQFLASGEGLADLDRHYDTAWVEGFRTSGMTGGIHIEERMIRRFAFEQPVSVTTLYKPLRSSMMDRPVGVIALNIYTDYMDNLLLSFAAGSTGGLLVVDEGGNVRFSSGQPLPDLGEVDPQAASFTLGGGSDLYYGAQFVTDRFGGWRYVSLATGQSLFRVSSQLGAYTAWLVLISFVLGLALAAILTRRSLRHVRSMVAIIQAAESDRPLPEATFAGRDDTYTYIIQNMTKRFIERRFLHIQLSEKKYRLQAAELLALQAQINPHFLFNTLEMVNWTFTRTAGRRTEANEMVDHLSALLRYSLESPGRFVTLEQEIVHTRSYIAIQEARYNGGFEVRWDYPEEDAADFGSIRLILQPLIENALEHGLRGRLSDMEENDRLNLIKIKMLVQPDHLHVSIIDNGRGIGRSDLHRLRSQLRVAELPDWTGAVSPPDGGAGVVASLADATPAGTVPSIGLINTHRRLKLAYPSGDGLRILGKPGFGAAVSFRLPLAGGQS